jgi:hypothetical protein
MEKIIGRLKNKMQKLKLQFKIRKLQLLTFGFVLALLILSVQAVKAATVYFESQNPIIYEGDTFIVRLKISSPDEAINAIEGVINYDGSILEARETSAGSSIFSLWPQYPDQTKALSRLDFTGGAPGGFQGEDGEVLKLIFFAKNRGTTKLDFERISAFLNDGKGTEINPERKVLTLRVIPRAVEKVPKDEWQDMLAKDRVPPKFIEAIISQDPSIFDNQYFVSFFATDEGSGIDHYEVKETRDEGQETMDKGQEGWVRAESPYRLHDQELKSYVSIKAVDKAGNDIVTTIQPKPVALPWYLNWKIWGIVIATLIAVFSIQYLVYRIGKR